MSTLAVVVHHHSERVIENCVRSLLRQKCPCDVLVVANSVMAPPVRRRLEELGARIVQLKNNVGFGRACNAGVRSGAAADYLWFVNPDVCCDPSCHAALLAHARRGTATAPAIRTADGRLERSVKSSAYLSARTLLLRELLVGRIAHLGAPAPPRSLEPVTMVSGACLFLHSGDFRAVGGFDDRFFLYGEDLDLSLRLRAAGVDLVYVPEAHVVHESGTGAGGTSPPPGVWEIKGRESRRAHARLLEAHVSSRAARRYRRGLAPVLLLRIAMGRLAGADAVVTRDRAALSWALERG